MKFSRGRTDQASSFPVAQISLLEGCQKILDSDCNEHLVRLHRGATHGLFGHASTTAQVRPASSPVGCSRVLTNSPASLPDLADSHPFLRGHRAYLLSYPILLCPAARPQLHDLMTPRRRPESARTSAETGPRQTSPTSKLAGHDFAPTSAPLTHRPRGDDCRRRSTPVHKCRACRTYVTPLVERSGGGAPSAPLTHRSSSRRLPSPSLPSPLSDDS